MALVTMIMVDGTMADISNKSLALLLLGALVVSLSSSLYVMNEAGTITGRALTSTGVANFTINNTMSIKFAGATVIPFGVGNVNSSQTCYLGTNQTKSSCAVVNCGCVDFNSTVSTQNLTIENDGSVPVNVSVNFTSGSVAGNASNFIGSGASFQFLVKQNESNSCGSIMNGTTFLEVNATGFGPNGAKICNYLDHLGGNDSLQMAFWIAIPESTPAGTHTNTVLATAS